MYFSFSLPVDDWDCIKTTLTNRDSPYIAFPRSSNSVVEKKLQILKGLTGNQAMQANKQGLSKVRIIIISARAG